MDSSNIKKQWVTREYDNRENENSHAAADLEKEFFRKVAGGNITEVLENLKTPFLQRDGIEKLSESPSKNAMYHFVITAALLARACIDNGMTSEEAFSLSDFYINEADRIKEEADLIRIHDEMVLDYTCRMNDMLKRKVTNPHIAKCIDYIYAHLHEKITLTDLADYVLLEPSYLSKLFKKETGMTVSQYVSVQKIETAKGMLLYSEYTTAEIATILDYPSQSYFTKCFREATGFTPGQFVANSKGHL